MRSAALPYHSSKQWSLPTFSFVWSFSSASLVVVNFLNNSAARRSIFASLCVQPKDTWSNNGVGSSKFFFGAELSAWSPCSVKSIPPNTENWLRKLYDKNYNNDTSTEDKHETNYSMNNDTRNMHITWACIESAQSLSHFVHLVSHAPHGSSLSLVTCHPCTCAFLLEFDFLTFHFDLSFPVFFFSFPLLHFELHTELDNLITMQNLRNSANKGSDDAYDVHTSLTGSASVQPFYHPHEPTRIIGAFCPRKHIPVSFLQMALLRIVLTKEVPEVPRCLRYFSNLVVCVVEG